jgi:hypothetical protein
VPSSGGTAEVRDRCFGSGNLKVQETPFIEIGDTWSSFFREHEGAFS